MEQELIEGNLITRHDNGTLFSQNTVTYAHITDHLMNSAAEPQAFELELIGQFWVDYAKLRSA